MEKESSFHFEQELVNELRERWNSTLQEVAKKVFTAVGRRLPEDITPEELPSLLEQATEQKIREKKESAKFVVVSASAGVGKTTVGQILNSFGMERLPRVTTRERRPDEVDGQDYFFVSRPAFEERKERGDLLYYKETYGEGRGIAKDVFDKHLASGKKFYAEGDALAYSEIAKRPEYQDVQYQSIFLLPPSFDDMLSRTAQRTQREVAEGGQEIDQREVMERLEKSNYYLGESGDHVVSGVYDGFLVNDDLRRVEEKLRSYV